MKQKEKIKELYSEYNPSFISGLDDAIIGYDLNTKKVVYSFQKSLSIIMLGDLMPMDGAREFINNRFINEYIFMDDLTETI